jgi:hypothetical protein
MDKVIRELEAYRDQLQAARLLGDPLEKSARELEAFSGGINRLLASFQSEGKSTDTILLAGVLVHTGINEMVGRIPADWRGHGAPSIQLQRAMVDIEAGAKALVVASRSERGEKTLGLLAVAIFEGLKLVPGGVSSADTSGPRSWLQRILGRRS